MCEELMSSRRTHRSAIELPSYLCDVHDVDRWIVLSA